MKAASAVAAAITLAASIARADEGSLLDAPAPPSLPALAHPSLMNTFEVTGAGIALGTGRGRALAWFLHDELEHPIISRTFYVGAAHDVVAAAVPGVGHDFFFGAPEIWTRGLWSSVIGLSSGGGFGVVLPLPHKLSPTAREIFDTVRVVRPWDAAYFTDLVVTLRPWIDVRHVVGRFILQLRQGMDIGIVARALRGAERRVDYTARTTAYVGFRILRGLGVGLEAWEVYQLSADLPDDKRSAFSISPSVRLSLGRIEPAFSVVFPVSTPLRGEALSYVAARLNVGIEFDAGRQRHAP